VTVPTRLLAPEPGWTADADVVIVGSGIAGLSTALGIARHSSLHAMLVTKDVLAAGSTRWAQGGIAAALAADDSPEQHLADTLAAGAGLCDEDAVRLLVREGPAAVRDLVQLGTRFDRVRDGGLALGREGGHHRDRIAHAGGDATGAEIERALVTRVLDASGVEIVEHALVLDLLRDATGAIAGVTLHVMGEGQRDGVGAVRARSVVIATGGIGQVYASTTNPSVSTGDGVAAALRAGAVVRDLEFVQFHPTVAALSALGARSHGQQPLVSEAVRGEGAFLVDGAGVRFMTAEHERADLAPRDVVAKAILRRMQATGAEHVWLDGRHFGAEKWRVRFPTIYSTLTSLGIDPVHELIPVVPACHYASGGIRTSQYGQTSILGLYACGEAACTGVHGANRLASNSLLEGLVFGRRIASTIVAEPGTFREPAPSAGRSGVVDDAIRTRLQRLMSEHIGVLRHAKGLETAQRELAEVPSGIPVPCGTENWEATNLHTVASVLATVVRLREETRGSHWRDDFPDRDDENWRVHLDVAMQSDGTLRVEKAT
jgi:L-aspartate oxidase